MASVSVVYNTLKSLANKDQRGFVTPTVFNTFTQVAQQAVFNRLIEEHLNSSNMRARAIQGEKEIARYKVDLEDLSFLTENEVLSRESGVFKKPQAFFRGISATTMGSFLLDKTTSVQIDLLYKQSDIDDILVSRKNRPTTDRPVALVANSIEVYPTSINKIKLRYYKIPQGISPVTNQRSVLAPRYGFTETTAGREIYDPSTSIDFELPDSMIPEIVIEIAKMIGINLNNQAVYQYAQQEEQTN